MTGIAAQWATPTRRWPTQRGATDPVGRAVAAPAEATAARVPLAAPRSAAIATVPAAAANEAAAAAIERATFARISVGTAGSGSTGQDTAITAIAVIRKSAVGICARPANRKQLAKPLQALAVVQPRRRRKSVASVGSQERSADRFPHLEHYHCKPAHNQQHPPPRVHQRATAVWPAQFGGFALALRGVSSPTPSRISPRLKWRTSLCVTPWKAHSPRIHQGNVGLASGQDQRVLREGNTGRASGNFIGWRQEGQ